MPHSILRTLALAFGLTALAVGAQAQQTFPTKPVRITTPFPVGSGPEGVLRLVADKLSKLWGQPVIVENKPGDLNYGSWSVGNPVHLGSALLETVTGTKMQHIIFKETTQLYTSVARGELAFALGSSATAGPLYRAQKIKFLAVAAPRRIPAYADVPTFAEAGGPKDFEVAGWTTIAAPRSLPAPVREKIAKDIATVLTDADFKEKYLSFGYEMFPATKAEFDKYIANESARQADTIKKAQASLD